MCTRYCTRARRSQSCQQLVVLTAALVSALGCATVHAGPLVIEESAKITAPDFDFTFGQSVAVGGNSIIVTRVGDIADPDFPQRTLWTYLYERNSSGAWVLQRTSFRSDDCPPCDQRDFRVAMNSLVAANISGRLGVAERTAAGWVDAPAEGFAANGGLAVHSGMILAGSVVEGSNERTCSDGVLFEKQGGIWRQTFEFIRVAPPGIPSCLNPGSLATLGEVDLSGSRVIVGGDAQRTFGEVQIWNRGVGGAWPQLPSAIVQLPGPLFIPLGASPFFSGQLVTIEGDHAFANSASRLSGPHHLRRDGDWAVVGNLQRPDRAMLRAGHMDLLNGFVAVAYADPETERDNTMSIFRRNAGGTFDYVAKLIPSDGQVARESRPAISGRRIVVGGRAGAGCCGSDVAYVFDLPTDFSQPALIRDDFEDRNAAEWTPIPGSVVSVPFNGLSAFYRQSSVAGDAGGLRTGVDMRNQSIEAEVVGRSFATGTGERWFGLSVRQANPDNLYYLAVGNGNVISLHKLENGADSVISWAPMPVQLNRRYKLRLEAIGSRIKGFVDGQLRLQAVDRSHKRGTPGLRMFRTATDYDNVVISPNPQTTLLSDDFEAALHPEHEPWWLPRLGAWTETLNGFNTVFSQTSIATDGRAASVIDTDDQAVQVRARATQFAAGDRWFGLMSRWQDDQNYYYLTVRSSNTVSLRKFVNGRVIVLDDATFPVSVGTWYTLRLEAVGNSLRGYVNNRPLVEAIDDDLAEGTWGLATSRAAAQFDNVRVTQP